MESKNVKRVSTYIKGFDILIDGGFPIDSNILISGVAGTGKTIFCLNFAYNTIIKGKQKVVYFTFEEKKEALYMQAAMFGWDLKDLEKKNKLLIISLGKEMVEKSSFKDLIEIVKSTESTRVILDSLTTLTYLFPHKESLVGNYEASVENFLYDLITEFQSLENVSALFISQENKELINRTAEYLCDGIINIKHQILGSSFNKNISIKKMRSTNNDDNLHPMEISKEGIIVHSQYDG